MGVLAMFATPAPAGGVLVLDFVATDPGQPVVSSRWTIQPPWLRIDDGGDGYVLFDDRSRTIYSVVHDDRSILQLRPPGGEQPVVPFALDAKRAVDAGAPPVAGRVPVRMQYFAEGNDCGGAVVAQGFSGEAVAVALHYRQALAEQQSSMAIALPEAESPCTQAWSQFAPHWPWADGVPVIEWHADGAQRELARFDTDATVDARLFELPAGYTRLDLSGL